jgi:hypothetical protein
MGSRRQGEDWLDLMVRAFLTSSLTPPPDFENLGKVLGLFQRSAQLRARVAELAIKSERTIVTGLVGKRPSRAELMRAHLFAGAGIGVVFSCVIAWVENGMRPSFEEVVAEAEATLRAGFGRSARK